MSLHEQDLLSQYDEIQVNLMKEEVLVVDENDVVIGRGSKKDTHLMEKINAGLLHRAFSVFLFNNEGKLLIQQRASEKITFPGLWANTCCSHPLWDFENELIEENQLGVKNAAIRKLHHELGIDTKRFTVDDFTYLTRIHYKAASDGIWGEHEIDYILIVKGDVELFVNPNEVSEVKWLSKSELHDFIKDEKNVPTPWFKIAVETFVDDWWENLDNLQSKQDDKIHKL